MIILLKILIHIKEIDLFISKNLYINNIKMDILKQKIDMMKQQEKLYIKFDFTGLNLSECEKLCDDMNCFMFILYEGEMVKRCKEISQKENLI